MKFLKHAFQMYKQDWKRVVKSPMAILMAVALIILPCFYAWFNIKALWDPYSNTGSLPVAVYSADKTAHIDALGKKISMNIGDEVVANLRKNHDIGWKFVDSEEQLVDGVKSGKYYAGIYMPSNFSSNLTSFISGKIKKPEIEYYVNEKINAIAPKITEKGAGSIQETITDEFIGTVSKTLVGTANKVGIDLDSHMMDITKVKDILLYADSHINEIEGYLNQVVDLDEKMPEIKGKLNDATSFVNGAIPQINQLSDKVMTLNQQMPTITDKLSPIMTLQQKIPEIENAGRQVKELDDNFGKIEETMNGAVKDAEKGLEVITQAQDVLPKVDDMLTNADGFVDSATTETAKLRQALPQVAKSINTSLALVQSIAQNAVSTTNHLAAFVKSNELTASDKKNIQQLATNLNGNLTNLNQMLQVTANLMNQLDQSVGSHALNGAIQSLDKASKVNNDMKSHVSTLASGINQLSTKDIMSLLGNINQLGQEVSSLTGQLDVSGIADRLSSMTSQLDKTLGDAKNVVANVKKLDVASLLSDTKTTLNQALDFVKEFQKEMPNIKQEVHDANTMINGNMSTITGAINKGAQFYKEGLPMLSSKIDTAANFMKNDLPTVEQQLQKTMGTVEEKMPTIENALNTTSALIQGQWPKLKQGIQKVASKIRNGAKNVDMKDFIKLLKMNADKEAKFMAAPVKVDDHIVYKVPNYGSQSAPFYTVLCLWVGGLLSVSLLTTEPYFGKYRRRDKQSSKAQTQQTRVSRDKGKTEEDDDTISWREAYVGKLFVFLSFAVVQAVAVTIGNFFILEVYAVNKWWYFLFTIIVAFTFMSIIYTFVGLFKDVGKAIGVIVLVLSISGGGGNFPIQLSGPFFQFIYPFLPFTYGVNLIREATGGIYWPNAAYDLCILLLFAIFFLVIGIILCPYLEKPMKKIEESVEETHFFS